MQPSRAAFPLLAMLAAATAAQAGGVFSSLEQFNYQQGFGTLGLRTYDAFDELDTLPDVTGLTISVNGGTPEVISQNPEYDNAFKRRLSWATVNDMVTARPVNATITHTLSGTPSGVVSITAPGHAYADAIPVSPIFSIQFNGTGANATWVPNGSGQNILYFNPTNITSFTVTMNRYGDSDRPGFQQGEYFASSLYVADLTAPTYTIIGAQSTDGVEAGQPDSQFSVTFTKGAPLLGGDSDPTTYGFNLGSYFNIEGEHANVFGLSDAGLTGDHVKAFIYQNNTSFLIRAMAAPVPEPATVASLAGMCALGCASLRRRRRA